MGCAYEPALASVMEKRRDGKCRLLVVKPIDQEMNEAGGNGHLNRRGQMRGATALRELVAQIMNW